MLRKLFYLLLVVLLTPSVTLGVTYSEDLCTGGTPISGGNGIDYSPEDAFDNDTNSGGWAHDNPWLNSYIGYDFGAGNSKIIQKYTLNGSGYGGFDPSEWIFQGSNDNISLNTIQIL